MTSETSDFSAAAGRTGAGTEAEACPWGHPAGMALLPVRAGALRGKQPILAARTDGEAVLAWLNQVGARSAKTFDAYQREAERLLFWAAAQGKALSELERSELVAYDAFLMTLPAQASLVAGRVWRRTDSRWRPFTRPLTENARHNTHRILSSLYRFLMAVGWLRANPLPPTRLKPSPPPPPLARCLDTVQTDAVVIFLDLQERYAQSDWERLTAVRDRWIVAVGIHLALRAGLCAHARMADFQPTRCGERTVWHFQVRPGSGAGAALPVTEECLTEFRRFRQAIGLAPLPAPGESFPLIPDFRQVWERKASTVEGLDCSAVTTKTIYRRIKAVFAGAAHLLRERAAYTAADRLLTVPPHSLRHTAIRDFVACVSDLTAAQQFARHSDCGQTARYVADRHPDLHAALAKRRSYT